MELLNTLGIDWRILLWQAAMFLVLLAVLRRFAYGPILDALDERRTRIEKGLSDAAAAEAARADADRVGKGVVAEAHRESARIVEEAKQAAEAHRAEALVRTRGDVERLLREGAQRLEQERGSMMAGAERELSGMLRLSLERVLGRAVTAADHERLAKEAFGAAREGGV